jgi:hypothetical protein
MFSTLGVCYGWYCCMIERAVSPWTTIQTPLSSGSNNFRLLVRLTMWASWGTLPTRRACRIAEYRDGCSIAETERWNDYISWFLDAGTRLRSALSVVALPI